MFRLRVSAARDPCCPGHGSLPRVPDRRDARDGPGPDPRRGVGRRAGHRHVPPGLMDRFRSLPMSALGGAGGAVHRPNYLPSSSARPWWSASGWPSAGRVHTGAGGRGRGARASAAGSVTRSPGWESAWGMVPAQPGGRRRRPGSSSSLPLTFRVQRVSLADPGHARAGCKPVAEWNPMSALAAASRQLFGNPESGPPRCIPGRCSTPELQRWSAGLWAIVLVFFAARWPSASTGARSSAKRDAAAVPPVQALPLQAWTGEPR